MGQKRTLILITSVIVLMVAFSVGIFLVWWIFFHSSVSPTPSISCGPSQGWDYSLQQGTRSDTGQRILKYLQVLYPQAKETLSEISDDDLASFYGGLHWYYLPLPASIDTTRMAPLTSYDKDSETIYYMADGFDCGQYMSDNGNGTSDFVCQVFSGCSQAEFNEDAGLPYQCLAFIKPFNRRDGFPSNSYVEAVDFPCETLGKMLENAPGCSSTAPPISCNGNNKQPSSKNQREGWERLPIKLRSKPEFQAQTKSTCTCTEYQNDPDNCLCPPGCTTTDPTWGQSTTCCWDWDSNSPDSSACEWPNMCPAYLSNGNVYNNYCEVPTWFQNFPVPDTSSGSIPIADFIMGNERWMDWLSNVDSSSNPYWISDLIEGYGTSIQPSKPSYLDSSGNPTGKVPSPGFGYSNKVMFYPRAKGYGKFINHGKTAIYFNYPHFLLTCPKVGPKGDTLRWFYPYILQVNQSNDGNSRYQGQLEALTNGSLVDKRYYLEGYITTLRGSDYEGEGENVEVLSNDMKWGNCVENVNGQINPLDDDFLRFVDSMTICKYYPPSSKVKNPQYGSWIRFTPIEAVALQAGAWIHGDSGADPLNRYFDEKTETVYVVNNGYFKSGIKSYGYSWPMGIWPFGSYFGGANLGGPAYDVAVALGLDSLQLTQMPTGLGKTSYCIYPGYDEESVVFMTHTQACKDGFVLLNPFADENYVNYGFVWGTGDTDSDKDRYGIIPFDATKMPLTERNTPLCWQNQHGGLKNSNGLYYNKDPNININLEGTCPYRDDILGSD